MEKKTIKILALMLGSTNINEVVRSVSDNTASRYTKNLLKRFLTNTININRGSIKLRKFLRHIGTDQHLSEDDLAYISSEITAIAEQEMQINHFILGSKGFQKPTSNFAQSYMHERNQGLGPKNVSTNKMSSLYEAQKVFRDSKNRSENEALFPKDFSTWVSRAVAEMRKLGFAIKPDAVLDLLKTEGNKSAVNPTMVIGTSNGSAAGPYQILLSTWNHYARTLSRTGLVSETKPATIDKHKRRTLSKDPRGPASLVAATLVVTHLWADSLKMFLRKYRSINFSLLDGKDQADLLYALHNMGIGNVIYTMEKGSFPPRYARSNNTSVFSRNKKILTKLRAMNIAMKA